MNSAAEQRFLVRVRLLDAGPERVANLGGAQLVELDAAEVVGLEAVNPDDLLLQRRQVPLLDVHAGADEALDDVVEDVAGERHQVAVRVGGLLVLVELNLVFEQRTAQRVDVLALLVHDVVVLEQVLADGEVLRLHLLLRPLDGARHHAVLDGDALFHPQTLHQARDAIGPEDAHQVVFERQVEARRTRVALTAGAAAQLVVDAPRFVPLGGDDVQAAQPDDLVVILVALRLEVPEDAIPVRARHTVEAVEVEEVDELVVVDEARLLLRQPLGDFLRERLLARHELGVAAQQDVGAAAGHVGGDGHGLAPAGLRDDLGFLRVVLRVEHDVLHAALLEQAGQPFRLLDRNRAHQRRPAAGLLLDDVGDDRVVLLALGPVDRVGLLDDGATRDWSG